MSEELHIDEMIWHYHELIKYYKLDAIIRGANCVKTGINNDPFEAYSECQPVFLQTMELMLSNLILAREIKKLRELQELSAPATFYGIPHIGGHA